MSMLTEVKANERFPIGSTWEFMRNPKDKKDGICSVVNHLGPVSRPGHVTHIVLSFRGGGFPHVVTRNQLSKHYRRMGKCKACGDFRPFRHVEDGECVDCRH